MDKKILEIMGNSSNIRILRTILYWKKYDLCVSDISRISRTGRKKTNEVIKTLLKYDILKKSRVICSGVLYKLNEKSRIVSKIKSLYLEIINYEVVKNGKGKRSYRLGETEYV